MDTFKRLFAVALDFELIVSNESEAAIFEDKNIEKVNFFGPKLLA